MKYRFLYITAVLLVFLISGRVSAQQNNIELELYKIRQTFYNIGNFYIDTVNYSDLADDALKEVISKLDPHSSFIPADEVKAMNEQLEGNFDGIGVEFAIIKDTLTIQGVVPGGPSERVGIKAGDKILSVDGENIAGTGLTIARVHGYLRGAKGTKVSVGVLRNSESKLLSFEITRDKIPLNSVDAAYMMPGDIQYIKLGRFAATSYREIMQAILPSFGNLNGIILDLRGNGGGYLLAALQIANEFLNRGEVILYTEGRAMPRNDEYANGRGRLSRIPLAVLIDENSASASEIVAGAIQDWDRGVIIGRRSFGKGLVQRQFDLADGSQIRLTIARYHTPSGRVIQSPYIQGDAEGYYRQFYRRYENGEYLSKDSIHLPDSLKFYTMIKKRTVYGGGGIMPDIFVPADTSYFSDFYSSILRKGILVEFVNEYTDANRTDLLKGELTSSEFENCFTEEWNSALFDNLVAFAKGKGVEYHPESEYISRNEIIRQVNGLIIRNLFDMNGYFRYVNQFDPEIQRAIEEIAR